MCNIRRFGILFIIFNTLISSSFGYKFINLHNAANLDFVRNNNLLKPDTHSRFRLNADSEFDSKPKELFSDTLSNPVYEKGVSTSIHKKPFKPQNKNLLKNLGKLHYEGVLNQIQNIVDLRVEDEKGTKSEKLKNKLDKFNNETDKQVISKVNELKKCIIYNQLRTINRKNNLKTERVLRTNDFIDGMYYRRLGESDFAVSQLCVGTSMYDNPELIDPEHSVEIMETALKRYGINYFDTCEYDPYPYEPRSYLEGHHRTLRKFIRLAGRENVILSGRISSSNLGKHKTSGRFLSWVRGSIMSPPSVKTIEKAVDKLLTSLGTDYLDVLSFVYPYRYVPLSHLGEDTQIDIFNQLVSKGKVRSVGLSNETTWGIYQMKYHKSRKFKLVCNQRMYNLLHRNEVESSGLVEASLKEHFNCPIVAYATLAGGILTGKYIDPERFNPYGADKIKSKVNVVDDQMPDDYEVPEDYGYLDYGPSNSRCNLFPETYHTHRTVWCQHATAEYLKLARTYGLTLSQMALAWCYTRPFIASTIIAPRSIGQLHESISALNYPFSKTLEDDIHEIFLRYRAPTMCGPQILTKIDEEYPLTVSQNDIVKKGSVPIWSGGSHWDLENVPPLDKIALEKRRRDEFIDIKRIFGLLDKPNDRNWMNYRCWVERINEGLPGEYFAVKESKLFSWDTMKLDGLTLVNKTPEEVKRDDTSDFHFYWKGGKVYVGPTSEAIYSFYKDREAQYNVMQQREISFMRGMDKEALDPDAMIWSRVDADLVYKTLMETHGIDVLSQDLEDLLSEHSLDTTKLTEAERKCEKFAYFNRHADKVKSH
ncbi:uncharacterized protein TOT_030000531 [Theileria orientalis strain Shintoku]|uniref:NADP-dependent oxidoreductase domain-containing protein n=1 Tax=Theileria orientalis strain Shintoku TaxID=869250 RepID=J4C8R9_THEOR|nr:uncharacterized protein TOT_030000531 [Theileria orientalis strain Shintoku]BAM41268.1 uncharacterized protein TOT_030000531 [Theileria orientalis strain Shintoku]|eukprot:XP_009691569.1 uncharacterized protein TOT_030000531 [Theileria orientalis strain Shintoku]